MMGTSFKVLTCLSAIIAVVNVVIGGNSTTGICEIEIPIGGMLSSNLPGVLSKYNIPNAGLRILTCCNGYNIVSHKPLQCIPNFPIGCGLGNCTAPGVCTCNKGAAHGPRGRCINVCPNGCLNGQCYGSFCMCNRGFTLESISKYCTRECTKDCGHGGQCVANNQCNCQRGYQLNQQGVCQLICNKGYKPVGKICKPQCVGGCMNGKCIAPNRCACNHGYSLQREGTCTRKCSSPCYNGFCSAPNVCTCKQGYVKDPTSPKQTCIPFCARGCANGICTKPNFCICRQGYVKLSSKSNVCVKRSN